MVHVIFLLLRYFACVLMKHVYTFTSKILANSDINSDLKFVPKSLSILLRL